MSRPTTLAPTSSADDPAISALSDNNEKMLQMMDMCDIDEGKAIDLLEANEWSIERALDLCACTHPCYRPARATLTAAHCQALSPRQQPHTSEMCPGRCRRAACSGGTCRTGGQAGQPNHPAA